MSTDQQPSQFCPLCEVTLDLHDGPDTCEAADRKARAIESFGAGVLR